MSHYSLVISHSSAHMDGIWIRGLSITDRLIGYSGYDVLVYSFNAVLLIHLKRSLLTYHLMTANYSTAIGYIKALLLAVCFYRH